MTAMNWSRGTAVRAALTLSLLLAATASAQVQKAPGFKIGEGRLHPFFEIDGRFDSLVGYFNALQPSPEIILHFRPGLKFDLDTPSTFVSFNGAPEFLWYTGALSPGSVGLSRFQANVGLDARFNRDGAVEFQIGDNLIRSDRTQNPAQGVGAISLFNNLYVAAPIHPGGRALEITPKVAWSVEFFEPLLTGTVPGCNGNVLCDTSLVARSNYSNLNFGANGRWKFLPKTAFMLDVNADWRTYFAGMGVQADKVIFRAQAGLVGLISPRIAVTLVGGYAGDWSANFHTGIANAEFSYTVSEQTRVAVGYARNMVPVPIVGAMIDDRGYARGGLSLLGGRLQLNAQVSADYLTFIVMPVRNDFLLSVNVGPTVTITSWFDVSASYGLTFRTSTVTLPTLNFPRHEAILRLNFHY